MIIVLFVESVDWPTAIYGFFIFIINQYYWRYYKHYNWCTLKKYLLGTFYGAII